jgi:hypothetical protein
MESALPASFPDVRVHDDATAAGLPSQSGSGASKVPDLPPVRGGEDVVWGFADVQLSGNRRYNFLVTEWRLGPLGPDLGMALSALGG